MEELEAQALREENEKLKTQLGQAEFTIEKVKREKAAVQESPKVNLEEIKAGVVSELREQLLPDVIESTLAELSPDPEERERVRSEYRTSIVKTGISKASIESDIRKAVSLVRSEKNAALAEELSKSVDSARATTSAGGGTNQDKAAVAEDWRRYIPSNDLAYMTLNRWPEERMKKAALAIKASRGL